MNITHKINDKGYSIKVFDKNYNLNFPKNFWKEYPCTLKKVLVHNLTFLNTMHSPLFLDNWKENILKYDFPPPLFQNFFFKLLIKEIPFCADADDRNPWIEIKKMLNTKYIFKKDSTELPCDFNGRKWNESAMVSMSFGKDSLLTFALAQEIGLEIHPYYVQESTTPIEIKHKNIFAKEFDKKLGHKVDIIKDGVDALHDLKNMQPYMTKDNLTITWFHLMPEYTLLSLPLSNAYDAKYIMLGNEKVNNDYYVTKEGFICNPAYDQSSEWVKELDTMTRMMSSDKVRTMSIIESLNDIAIIKLLHERYPQIGKYQMSCFPDYVPEPGEQPMPKDHYWCHDCSKCARIYIFMLANGFNPKRIGFKHSLLQKKSTPLYSLFAKDDDMLGFDKSGVGRDEQLLAFYLAHKKGVKGYIMDKFRSKHLSEAVEKEDQLIKRFFTVYSSPTTPRKIKIPVKSVLKEGLSTIR